MKKVLTNTQRWIYPALAFMFPFLGITLVMLVARCTPFGSNSFLYSDMYHQYYPFFKEFRRVLLSGESLLYNWSIGLGVDYLSLIAYYLASPVNFLAVFVPEAHLLGFFSLLVPLKLGVASLFFSIFLKRIFDHNDLSISIFGAFYGLCAWALAYQWNIMWLDTFALLPLVILGMTVLLKQNKFVLYTITLFLSVFTNYYIGFFTCCFVFLSFFCYGFCNKLCWQKWISSFLRIALYSALAIFATAILTLPALTSLKETHSSINTFPNNFRLNIASENTIIGLLDAMRQVAGNMNAGITLSFKEGLPNIYCGTCTVFLCALYLSCTKIRCREKICTVVLLLFFNISFVIRQLDYIWHGFHFPNMIPYRFSFLYSFVMLYMAYSAWIHRNFFSPQQVIIASILTISIILCYRDLTDIKLVIYNSILLLCYAASHFILAASYYRNGFPRFPCVKCISIITFSSVMFIELTLHLVNFGLSFPKTNVSDYPKGTVDTALAIQYMQAIENEDPFYRTEVTHPQTLNDGALNGYNGVTAFTSSANVKVTKFMETLGHAAKDSYNRYSFEESSPVSNLFLAIRFMLDRESAQANRQYSNEVVKYENITLLENNAYLPLGFLANSELLNLDFVPNSNPFSFQNQLLQKSSGINGAAWNSLSSNDLKITSNISSLESNVGLGFCSFETSNTENNTITYQFTAKQKGVMCIYLDLTNIETFQINRNSSQICNKFYSLPQMLAVDTVQIGDIITVQLQCKESSSGSATIHGAILDDAQFRKCYAHLSQSVLNITEFKSTQIDANITCTYSGVLYTSIPQNGYWQAVIDGTPEKTILIGDAMIGIPLSEGHHEIQLQYQNKAFSFGWKISLVSIVIFFILWIWKYRLARCIAEQC